MGSPPASGRAVIRTAEAVALDGAPGRRAEMLSGLVDEGVAARDFGARKGRRRSSNSAATKLAPPETSLAESTRRALAHAIEVHDAYAAELVAELQERRRRGRLGRRPPDDCVNMFCRSGRWTATDVPAGAGDLPLSEHAGDRVLGARRIPVPGGARGGGAGDPRRGPVGLGRGLPRIGTRM